jgi:methylmalonyl-CoA mutase cobalamin-binding domain/chain
MVSDILQQLSRLFLAADRAGANRLIDDWAAEHDYERAVLELLEPALELFGETWAAKENISLAQGYIAAKIAEDVMLKLSESQPLKTPGGEPKGTVVVGNIEDDYHALGRKLIATFLRTAGWNVIDLGNDVPAPEFVNKAVEVGAKVIGASAMMNSTAENIKKLRKEIDDRGLTGRIQLAVGGAVFRLRPEMVGQVGGDGTVRNAIAVPGLVQELWDRAEAAEKGEPS